MRSWKRIKVHMIRTKMSLFLTLLLLTAGMAAQPKPAQSKPAQKKPAQDNSAQWIAKLKATPLADIESGLPDRTFGKWFADQARPGVPQYTAKPCEIGESSGPMCVVASANVSRTKRLELTFALMGGERTVQNDKNPAAKQATCRFLVGSVGPRDPRMKFPTQVIRKLSDLPPLVRGHNALGH